MLACERLVNTRLEIGVLLLCVGEYSIISAYRSLVKVALGDSRCQRTWAVEQRARTVHTRYLACIDQPTNLELHNILTSFVRRRLGERLLNIYYGEERKKNQQICFVRLDVSDGQQ